MGNKLVRFNEGTVLFKVNELSQEMYIIRSGIVSILIEKEGKMIPLTELGKGQYVGEMSFLTGIKRSATAVAKSGVMANVITPDVLREENIGISSWAVNIAKVLVRRIRATTDLLGDYLMEEDENEKQPQRRAEDLKIFDLQYIEKENTGRISLKGQFTEHSIEPLKAKLRELRLRNIESLVLDFSDVIDIDQAGINYLYTLIQSAKTLKPAVNIENMQLIRDKVLTIKGIHDILVSTNVPLKHIDEGQILITQGSMENTMYVVKSGLFDIYRSSKTGRIDLGQAGPGDVIGEMTLIKNGKRSANVQAVKGSVVYVVQVKEFYGNTYNIPNWFMDLINGLVQRLRDTDEMLDQIKIGKKQKDKTNKWKTPLGIVLDSQHPGKFGISGFMTLQNFQSLLQLIRLQVKMKTKNIILDMTKVKQIEAECIPLLLCIYTQLKAKGIVFELKGPQKEITYLLNQYSDSLETDKCI